MKKNKILFFLLIFPLIQLFAGPDCLSNTTYEAFDTKEWHPAHCLCDCRKEIIRGGKCIQCEHLQNARPLTIFRPFKSEKIYGFQASLSQKIMDPKKALEILVQQYRKNLSFKKGILK